MSSVRTEPDRFALPKKQDKLPARLFISLEKNLASLGFFTPSTKRIQGAKKKTVRFTRETEGKRIQLRATILPSAEYGLPITADQDKYLALQKIVTDIRQREGMVTNPVGFTSAELLRILGLRVRAGKNYDDIVDWAKRMTLTGICSEGMVYFAGRKTWATDTFHVFERFVSCGKELPDGRMADKNYVWLSEWQLENINSNYLLPIDFDRYRQLRNHIAKALVPLLQIWLYATRERGCFEKRYDDLCQVLNIRQYPHLSTIKEKLKPSIQELIKHGYLSNWQIQLTRDGTGYKICFYHGAKFRRDYQEEAQTTRLLSWRAQNALGVQQHSPPSLPDADVELLSELTRRGISEKTARELLGNLVGGQQVIDQLEWADFQIQQAPIGKFYNPSGFYIRIVRENIMPPQSFETSRKRELREDAHGTWQKEQEEKAALRLAYGAYLEKALEQYIRKNYSKEFYISSVRSKLARLLSQDQRLKQMWDDETLYRIAEKRLRQGIAVGVSSMTFQEFCEQRRPQTDPDQQLLPACITVQSVRS
jgi:hypothetical protein